MFCVSSFGFPSGLKLKISSFSSLLVLLSLGGDLMAADSSSHIYIGTYSGGKSKGIYLSKFDAATGKLTAPELAVEAKNPSFLCLHPNGKILYTVAETDAFDGQK